MKKTFQVFVLFLAVVAVLTSCFTACGDKDTPADDTGTAGSVEKNDDLLTLIEGGNAKCTIVFPFSGDQNASSAAFALKKTLKQLYGIDIPTADDYDNDTAVSTDDVEILVGTVKRTEAEEACARLDADTDWLVHVNGNKLVIVAASAEGYERALAYLQANCLKEGGTDLALSRTLSAGRLLAQNVLLQNVVQSYTIVFAEGATERVKTAAQTLKTALAPYGDGKEMTVTSDATAATAYEILVGETNRKESKTGVELFYYDYLIRKEGNKIAINAGGSFAVQNAVEQLVSLLVREDLEDQYIYRFDTSLFNPLAYDQSTFVPAWQGSITVPTWMTNFDEKLYAITNPSGRPMCVAHRGDVINYPEDSLESFLSAALLGADVIEMDLQLTKDNIMVLCHDTTLTKTTNVASLKGKNGLPDSENVVDWTYAELQQLSLLDVNGNVTQYKLPSYYEILLTLRGRCFLAIDQKVSTYHAEDVLEMATETDAVELSFYSMFLSASSGPAQSNSYQTIIDYSKAHPEMTRLSGYAAKMESYMKLSGHRIRSRGWLGGKATTDPSGENHEIYQSKYEGGLRLIYTNNIPLMSTFIAKYQPDLTQS